MKVFPHKDVFLSELKKGLEGFAEEDIQKFVDFYAEMIDDRIEDGKTEEEAVADLGDVNEIIEQIQMEMPLPKLMCAKMKPKHRLSAWEIVLITLGFPIWGSLAISVIAVVLSLFVSLWAVLISLYAVPVSLAASALGCLFAVVVFAVPGLPENTMCMVGASRLMPFSS